MWTSSFITRPSLPVPTISSMFASSSLRSPRTAGVANDVCLNFGRIDALKRLWFERKISCSCSIACCGCCGEEAELAGSIEGVIWVSSSTKSS